MPGRLATVSAFPNPVKDVLIISQVDAGDAMTLVDMRGEMLSEIKVKASEKDYKLPIALITEGIFYSGLKIVRGGLS